MAEHSRFPTELETAERNLCILARSTRIPQYCRRRRNDRSNDHSYVRLNGIRHTLGPYGSDASVQEYRRIVSEWLTNGCLPLVETESLTLDGLVARFIEYADKKYRRYDSKHTSTFDQYKMALRPLCNHYGDTPAGEFNTDKFVMLREVMIDSGQWSRKTINQMCRLIVAVFKWATARNLVPAQVHQSLWAEEPLKKGRTTAREMPRVRPVDWEQIEAILPHVSEEIVISERPASMTRPSMVLDTDVFSSPTLTTRYAFARLSRSLQTLLTHSPTVQSESDLQD